MFPSHCSAHATFLDAAAVNSWPLRRCCNAPGCCKCCFLAAATVLRRSRTRQLLLPGPCSVPATILDAAWPLQCLCNAHLFLLLVFLLLLLFLAFALAPACGRAPAHGPCSCSWLLLLLLLVLFPLLLLLLLLLLAFAGNCIHRVVCSNL